MEERYPNTSTSRLSLVILKISSAAKNFTIEELVILSGMHAIDVGHQSPSTLTSLAHCITRVNITLLADNSHN
uniref:Uncharacterized protein n=1 Tax=Oryza meridionalis TaxID=40149 RepID=A0A0E0E403_9ORYZ